MAKVKIQGHASGTGVLTVTAPNTSSDRTITLPDSTGTILDENSSLPAANLTGTVADARFPATLPAISGASLTNLPSSTEYAYIEQSYDSSTTGAMALTGAGFTPKFVLIFLGQGSTEEISIGCATGTGSSDRSSVNQKPDGDKFTIQPELAFMIEGGDPEDVTKLRVASFDADGITFTKAKNNSPTGTVVLSAFLFA